MKQTLPVSEKSRYLFLLLCLMCSLSLQTFAQSGPVTGTVIGSDDLPLPGAYVTVKGTTRGVVTDVDGTYSIPAVSSETLVFSFIGMETQNIEVGNQSVINVTLQEDMAQLETVEVVSFGYGTVKRTD